MPFLTKIQVDDIRIAMLLICDEKISLRLKISKLGMIGRYCNLPSHGLLYFETWLRESTDYIMLKKYDNWKVYFRDVLSFVEEYEVIVELRLDKVKAKIIK